MPRKSHHAAASAPASPARRPMSAAGRRAVSNAAKARHKRAKEQKLGMQGQAAAATITNGTNGYSTPEQRDQAQMRELQTMLTGAKAHALSARRDVTNIEERIKLLRAQIAARPAATTERTMTAGG